MSNELSECTLVTMGNPLLDVLGAVDEEFLEKYGLKPNDAILAEEKHMPLYDEMISKYSVEYIAGGSAQNSARVAQYDNVFELDHLDDECDLWIMSSRITKRECMFVAVDNPLLDISATVDDNFLRKYRLKPDDAILAGEIHQYLYRDLTANFRVEYTAGGSSLNVVRVAQWLLNKPFVCGFIGCVGSDEYSRLLSEKAKEDGVKTFYQQTKSSPTGTCAVLISSNGTKRSLCANLAAANCFTIDHLDRPEVQKALNNAEYYYISSFFLTVSTPTVLTVAKKAFERNKIFAMNLSAQFLCSAFKEQQMQVLPYVDILFGNESEALTFALEHKMGTKNLAEIALKISALPKENRNYNRIVIITQGELPAYFAQNGKTKEYPVVGLASDQIVDTNGAGDAFVGGFMSQLIQGQDYDKCMRCAAWAASKIIQNSGCTFSGKASFS